MISILECFSPLLSYLFLCICLFLVYFKVSFFEMLTFARCFKYKSPPPKLFSIYLVLCVSVVRVCGICVCGTCPCVCGFMCLCTHLEATIRCLSFSFSTLHLTSLRQGLLTKPGIRLAARKLKLSSCLCLPQLWGCKHVNENKWVFTKVLRIWTHDFMLAH